MRRTAVVLIGASALSLAATPAFAAEGDPLTGYWSRTRTGLPVPLQPVDRVPEGGTWVSGDPAGAVAVSALRTDLVEGLVGVELRLTIAESLGTPAVQACPSTDRWAPEQNGRLEAAPEADCSAPLDAKVEGDVLVVPLPPGLDLVNVLLRPKPGATFSLTMKRATAASVVTAPPPSATLPTAPGPAFGPPTQGTSQGTTQGPAFDSSFGPALDPLPVAVAAEPVLAAPMLPEAAAPAAAPAPLTAPAPVQTQLATPRATVAPEGRTPVLLATAVLVLLGAQALRLAAQPATAPRALGGAARLHRPQPTQVVVAPARGVGRFRRPAELAAAPLATTRGVGRFRSARVRPPVRI